MYKIPDFSTGGPSSSYEMIILRTNSHGGIIRVCIIIFTTALGKRKYVKFSKTKPHLTSTTYCLLSDRLLWWKERISASCAFLGISTYIRKAQGWKTPFPNARSEKRKIPAQNDRAATNPTQNPSTYTVVSFQFTTNSIFPVQPTLSHSFLQKFPVQRFLTARVHINLDTRSLKTS